MKRTDDEILAVIEPRMREFAVLTAAEAAKQFEPNSIAPVWMLNVFTPFHSMLRELVFKAGGDEATCQKIRSRTGAMFAEEYEKLVPLPVMH